MVFLYGLYCRECTDKVRRLLTGKYPPFFVMKLLGVVFQLCALSALSTPLNAAISYSTVGGTLTENFDSLANTGSAAWSNDSTLPGWHASFDSFASENYYAADGTTANAWQLLSLGSQGSSDRALGSQSADDGTGQHRYAVEFINTTGGSLNQISITYAGEVWRAISGEGVDGLTFEYNLNWAGWVRFSALDFISPVTASGGSIALDGNLAANRAIISSELTGVNWGNGQSLFLRWTDNGVNGNLQAKIGIDDFSFTAVPEPSVAILGFAGLLVTMRRRR
jgi:hypothetical protein